MISVHVEVHVDQRAVRDPLRDVGPSPGVVPAADELKAATLDCVDQPRRIEARAKLPRAVSPLFGRRWVRKQETQLAGESLVIAGRERRAEPAFLKQLFVDWNCGRHGDRPDRDCTQQPDRVWGGGRAADDGDISTGDELGLVPRLHLDDFDPVADLRTDPCRWRSSGLNPDAS